MSLTLRNSARCTPTQPKRFVKIQDIVQKLTDLTGIDLSKYEPDIPELIQLRNEKLFPLIKQKTQVIQNHICL
jgi:hypothetical protein